MAQPLPPRAHNRHATTAPCFCCIPRFIEGTKKPVARGGILDSARGDDSRRPRFPLANVLSFSSCWGSVERSNAWRVAPKPCCCWTTAEAAQRLPWPSILTATRSETGAKFMRKAGVQVLNASMAVAARAICRRAGRGANRLGRHDASASSMRAAQGSSP
jgi:hypothetical protein